MEKSIARLEPTWFGRTAGAFVALALATLTTQASAAGAHKAGEVVMETASVKTAGGETVRFETGTLYVPENRAVPGSRVIGVGFARIRAAIIEFLKTGDTRAIPVNVTLPAPPFRRPSFPAPEKPSGP